MAFKNGLSEHLDDLRLSSPRSPPSEAAFSGFPSPPGTQPGFSSAFQSPPTDIRSNMQRRFTTDSTKVAPFTGFASQVPPLPDSSSLLSSATHLHKSHLVSSPRPEVFLDEQNLIFPSRAAFEKKRQHVEQMRQQRKQFEADLKLLDLQQEQEKKEMDRIAQDLANTGLNDPVSEPTTPPEYREAGFPTMLSRPARFSISSTNPSSSLFGNAFSPSQTTTPATTQLQAAMASTSNNNSESMLGSRRNSEFENNSNQFAGRRPGHSVRYSLPTSNIGPGLNGTASNGVGFTTAAGFGSLLSPKSFDDDGERQRGEERMSTPDVKSYLRMTDPDDKFPTLMRRDDHSGMLSVNSAAHDLANSRTPVPDNSARHHSAHQSLPQNALGWVQSDQSANKNGSMTTTVDSGAYTAARHGGRLSLESSFPNLGNVGQQPAVTRPVSHSRPTSLHLSYSTNDIPTAQDTSNSVTPPQTRGDQFQHGHSMPGTYAPPTPQSGNSGKNTTPPTPLSSDQESQSGSQNGFSGVTFPAHAVSVPARPNGNDTITSPVNSFPPHFYGFGVQQFAGGPLPVNGNQVQGFNSPSFGPYAAQQYASYPRFNEGPRAANQGRRENDSGPFSRFSNVPLENYKGELYGLCKDQHGCRYLQRKLEERVPENVQMIFAETNMHVVELMTDPFGNYLCQKLLEFSNDDQRTALIRNAAPQLVQIAFNQHGTRALQKMIEFVSTADQTQMVIGALRDKVVELVQDLNGNHVIQKCLNRLSAPDAQFIYDSVGASCVTVGTHRHGCCVLQRCIDHASGEQRARLVAQITTNAFALVQDPFGNYVVQYILDLSEPHFTEPLCQTFRGNVPALSKQKFSSNVIEKCIRTADFQTRRLLIQEMMGANELERMLRDSFANYVVQTAIDFADPDTRGRLIDAVRPILPVIRQTPHGRRIAGKMVSLESQSRPNTNGQVTPNGVANEENGVFGPGRPFPTVTTNFPPQFKFPDNMIAKPPATVSSDSTSTKNGDDTETVIFSPTPQHSNNAINGLNGVNAANFSLY